MLRIARPRLPRREDVDVVTVTPADVEIEGNPMLRIARPRLPRREDVDVVTVTPADVEKMLLACEG